MKLRCECGWKEGKGQRPLALKTDIKEQYFCPLCGRLLKEITDEITQRSYTCSGGGPGRDTTDKRRKHGPDAESE